MKRLVIIALTVSALAAGAAIPVSAKGPDTGDALKSDNIPTPLTEKQTELKQAAQELVLSGQATPKGKNKVVKLAPGQFVELAFEGEDQILTLLGEFGPSRITHTPATRRTTAPRGPLHNTDSTAQPGGG